jgi:hypothetical protein
MNIHDRLHYQVCLRHAELASQFFHLLQDGSSDLAKAAQPERMPLMITITVLQLQCRDTWAMKKQQRLKLSPAGMYSLCVILCAVLSAAHAELELLLRKHHLIALADCKSQIVIAYEVHAADYWNENDEESVCYWTETSAASLSSQQLSKRSLPQCVSVTAGNFTITALAGDTLKIQAAVVQLSSLSDVPVLLSNVVALEVWVPSQLLLHLEHISDVQLESGGGFEVVVKYRAEKHFTADWNEDMMVCYWISSFDSSALPLLPGMAGQCLLDSAGTFTVESAATGFSQVNAAIVKRGSTVINKATMLSDTASLTLRFSDNREDLPLCRDSQHIRGYWAPAILDRKAFVCCESSDDDHAARSKYCGHIQHHQVFDIISGSHEDAPYYMHAGLHSCCEFGHERLSASKRESYRWTPHTCTLTEWDAHSFCTYLGNRSMVFIGDSTMHQTAVTVTNMLVAANATCIQQISYALSDTLVGKELGVFNRGRTLLDIVQALRDSNDSIVVLSTGPHIYTEFESVLAEVAQTIQQLRNTTSGLTFVWRTQQPGHRLCGLATVPAQYIQEVSNTIHTYIHLVLKFMIIAKLHYLAD